MHSIVFLGSLIYIANLILTSMESNVQKTGHSSPQEEHVAESMVAIFSKTNLSTHDNPRILL